MTHSYNVTLVPMNEIYCDNEFNCRGPISAMSVIDLANDIKANGLDTPISLQLFPKDLKNPGNYKYRILAGHRRFTAFKVNNETEIPAFIIDVADDSDARVYNLRENIFRQNLTLLQEAKAIAALFTPGNNIHTVAQKLGRSDGWVQVRKQLLELPPEVQEEADKGTVNQGHIKSLYNLRNNREKLFEALRKLKEQLSKGQKVVIKKQETTLDLIKKKRPSDGDVTEAQEFISKLILNTKGNHFAARAIAWLRGEISKLEFYASLKAECNALGVAFDCPEELKSLLKVKNDS